MKRWVRKKEWKARAERAEAIVNRPIASVNAIRIMDRETVLAEWPTACSTYTSWISGKPVSVTDGSLTVYIERIVDERVAAEADRVRSLNRGDRL